MDRNTGQNLNAPTNCNGSAQQTVLPLVEPLTSAPDPEHVFRRLCNRPHCLWLDSALRHPERGRYSFLAADPFDYWQTTPSSGTDLAKLAARLSQYATPAIRDLPPFQGGAAGVLGYGLGHALETLPRPAFDEFQVPTLALGWYDVVVAWDHAANSAWIVSQGLPELEPAARQRRAAARLQEFRQLLAGNPASLQGGIRKSIAPIAPDQLAPQFPADGASGLTSNFSHAQYLRAAERAIRYVCEGDIFQVNLSQRLLLPARDDSAELYVRLRERNPAPMAGYFNLGTFQVVSSSPERFMRVEDRLVETRPIKGTRNRMGDRDVDGRVEAELLESEKDRAENTMIVDLSRNDLARVCEPASIRVPQLCGLERYPFVIHLVSVITGRLQEGMEAVDLIRAAFPGGSITGAPKVRAMEIIAELEPTARGPYCGSLGYFGLNGAMDLSILIRTIAAGRGWWQIPVGGAIVAQSDPQREYEETWHKAEGMLQAVGIR